MVRFKGRSSFKTVIKGKPTPIGYKLYTIASDGYLLTFHLYRGKGGYAVKQGVIHHTVTQMVLPWRDSHRILFTDNLYTTPALCRHLLTIGLRSCGSFRANRSHLPPGLKDAIEEIGEGETKAWQSGQLGCLVWCDKQTRTDAQHTSTGRRHDLRADQQWTLSAACRHQASSGPRLQCWQVRCGHSRSAQAVLCYAEEVYEGLAFARMVAHRYVYHQLLHPLAPGHVRYHRTARLPSRTQEADTCCLPSTRTPPTPESPPPTPHHR